MIRSTCADIELAPHRLPGSAPALAHHGARRLALSQLRRGHGLTPHTIRDHHGRFGEERKLGFIENTKRLSSERNGQSAASGGCKNDSASLSKHEHR